MLFFTESIKWIFSGIGGVVVMSLVSSKWIFKWNKRIKVENVFDSRSSIHYMGEVMKEAKHRVDFVFVTGNFISLVHFEKYILEYSHVHFNVLVLEENSVSLQMRREDNEKHGKFIVEEKPYTIEALQRKYPSRINIYYYDNYPYWHLVRIDNNLIYFSTNPIDKQGYSETKLYKVRNKKNSELYTVFDNYITILLEKESVRKKGAKES